MRTRLARWLAARRATPFGRLVEHFFTGVFRSGGEAGADEFELSISGLLALLAVPGAFMALSLFGKYSSLLRFIKGEKAFDVYVASLPDKYFFIAFSMAVTGIVAVLKWDKILPSRQDYFTFASLPFPVRNIFLANLLAILLAVSLFAVDVNAASTILFPLVATADGGSAASFLGFVAAHAVCVILASLFTFFAFFAFAGALMMVLPNALFARVSLSVRVASLAGLLTLLTTAFAIPALVRRGDPLVAWLPPVWFLGLYQTMQARATPQLESLGTVAWQASAAAFVAAMAVYAIGYRRYFLKIPETLESQPSSSSAGSRRAMARLDRLWLRSDFQRACYHFAMKTLLRSETHCLFFGGFVALGIVTAAQRAVRAADTDKLEIWLSLSYIAAYCLVAGLRFVFEMPVGLRANVVFRSGLDPAAHEAGAVARKVMWTFLVPAVLLPALAFGGALHAACVAFSCWLLMEILLLRFRKIPFTCSMPPFQNHVIMLFFFHLLGFVLFALILPAAGARIIESPRYLAALPVAGAIALYFIQQARGDVDHDRFLIYEDRPEAAITVIGLGD